MERKKVTKDKDHVALKVEHLRGIQSFGSSEKEKPSKSVKMESWYKMTMQDAKEKEDSRSMIRGKYSKTCLSEMVWINFYSEEETDHVEWRASMVEYLTTKRKPPLGGRSTFLAKREC